ncbi:ABC transporter substrate-binding protein [Pusillimonas sp. TS35]|nr:ABC transporter substrate-binding protein [Pusillimonas sp. TS35]
MKYFSDLSINRRRFLNATGASAVLALSGLPMRDAYAQAQTGTLVIGHTTVRHLNPAIQSGQATGVPGVQLFAGLLQMDDKFQPHPYLAKSWTVSDDGLVYSFKLVEGAVFHDGKPITSEDVAFSLDIVKANHPFGSSMFKAVGKVETPDAHTVILRLDYPQPALPAALSPLLLPILPKHVYSTAPIQGHPANTAVVGSGPFKLVEFKAGQHIIMERNPRFFRENRPYLDRLIFRINKDSINSLISMERGEINYLPFAGVRVRDLGRLESNPKIRVTSDGYEALGATNYLEINHRKTPLNDVRVRQAIAHAMDKDFIANKLLAGKAKRMDGPLTKSNVFYSKDDLTIYAYDIEKANALLDAAGLARKADGSRVSLTLEWLPDVNVNSQEPVAQYLKAQLRKVGINIELRANPDFPTWSTRVSNWEYDLTMNGMWNYPDPVIGVNRAYLSTNQKKGVIYSNTEGYSNPRVDEILAAAGREQDFNKRKELYGEFQKIVTNELPLIWTNEEPLFTIYDANLVNVPSTVWGPLGPWDEMRWKA